MKKFIIAFQDAKENEIYSITKKFIDWIEASHYAKKLLANSPSNCVYFSVMETN